MGDHLLVCRPDFPDRHAWLVTATLAENGADIPDGSPPAPGTSPIPAHPGALAYANGKPLPPGSTAGQTESDGDHGHPH
jgi:hypothetical protein